MKCPKCKSENVAWILYGLPNFDKKMEADLESGKIILGGCEHNSSFPKYHCNECKYEFSPKK